MSEEKISNSKKFMQLCANLLKQHQLGVSKACQSVIDIKNDKTLNLNPNELREAETRERELTKLLKILEFSEPTFLSVSTMTLNQLNSLLVKYKIPTFDFAVIMYNVILSSIKKTITDEEWEKYFVNYTEISPSCMYSINFFNTKLCDIKINIGEDTNKLLFADKSEELSMVDEFEKLTGKDIGKKIELFKIIYAYMTPTLDNTYYNRFYKTASSFIEYVEFRYNEGHLTIREDIEKSKENMQMQLLLLPKNTNEIH